jgi:hypothetical protein
MNRDDQLSEAATESTYFTAPALEARTSRQECKMLHVTGWVVGEILVGWLVIGSRTLVALPQDGSRAGACVSRWALLASESRFRRLFNGATPAIVSNGSNVHHPTASEFQSGVR